MWWALDVQYYEDHAVVAGVGFVSFADDVASERVITIAGPPADYEPGQFYKREMPHLLAFLDAVGADGIKGVVVDGFVWLGLGRKGLGAHLYDALDAAVPVIGVAKTGFSGADAVAAPVRRGESDKPLWITAEGLELAKAARRIEGMVGPYRIPTLLKRVDRLCRGDD